MSARSINMRDYLAQFLGRRIMYVPNPGNAGDKLIAYATLQLMDSIGLDYLIGDHEAKYDNEILFYGGGGNLVGPYKQCQNFLINNMGKNEIVVLPQTVNNQDQLLATLDPSITLICREQISYDYVVSLVPDPKKVLLSHDLALSATGFKELREVKGTGVCNCFRSDTERTSVRLPSDNLDLAILMNTKANNARDIASCVMAVFDHLSKFSEIRTNRLHMAIAGHLLGKNVHLHVNSYYKNRAVFEHSLHATGISLHAAPEEQPGGIKFEEGMQSPVGGVDVGELLALAEECSTTNLKMAFTLIKLGFFLGPSNPKIKESLLKYGLLIQLENAEKRAP